MKYISRLLCVAILIWAIFSFSSRPAPKHPSAKPPPPPAVHGEKISVKSSAPAKTTKKSRAQILSDWIQEDQLCDGKGHYLRNSGASESTQLYHALELARGNNEPNPCLSALLSKEKKQILRYASKSDHESCRLIRALVLTGQMDSGESSAREIARGRAILKELASGHPENGVYPFFLFGSTKEKNHFGDFLRAREFKNPITALSPRLREIGLTNATSLFYSVEALSSQRMPNYQLAQAAARELIAAPEFKADYQEWLKRYLADLEEIRRLKLGEPHLWTIEIAILRAVANAGWTAHGEGPKPPLLEKAEWMKLFRQITNQDFYEPFYVNEEQACERIQEAATALLPDFAFEAESMDRRAKEYR